MQMARSETASAAGTCTRLASSSGSDSAAGTPAAPFRTVGKLLASVQPGDVACLAAGQTFGSQDVENAIQTDNVTLQSAPGGAPATLIGLTMLGGKHDTVSGLTLDGHNTLVVPSNPATSQGQAGVFIEADDAVVRDNDISNGHTAICFEIGVNRPARALIDNNRIHGCGILPITAQIHQHGIYVENAIDTRITNNLIYDIADWGVHIYPNATNTYVANNVIALTGSHGAVIIAAEGGPPSSGNTITRNIITHTAGYPVATYWGGSPGTGNVATDNCVADTLAQVPFAGLTVSSEKVVANAGLDSNYRLSASSSCLGYGPAGIQPSGSNPPPPPPAPPAPPKPPAPPTGGGTTTTPPRGGPAVPVAPTGGSTPAGGQVHTVAPEITSPLTGGTPAVSKPGVKVKTYRFRVKWNGKKGKTYQLRVDKGHWFSVKGRVHTFKHLRAGKHTIALRLKGSHGKGVKSVIKVG